MPVDSNLDTRTSARRAGLSSAAGHLEYMAFLFVMGMVLAACEGPAGKTGPPGPQGQQGPGGNSCTVSDNNDGTKTITCEDGTTVVVSDGQAGASCTVTDNGDGTKTISCEDGTTVTVSDGTGQACWDLNDNGVADPASEDINGDGSVDAADCRGQPGKDGKYPFIPAEYEDLNLIQLHNPNSPQYMASQFGACTDCHGDRMDDETLDPSQETAHQAMFAVAPFNTLEGSERCEYCHTYDIDGNRIAVDIMATASGGSAGVLRKQVDVRRCAACHGPGASVPLYMTATP